MKNNTNIILFIITLFMNNSNKQVGTKGAHIRDNIIEFIDIDKDKISGTQKQKSM